MTTSCRSLGRSSPVRLGKLPLPRANESSTSAANLHPALAAHNPSPPVIGLLYRFCKRKCDKNSSPRLKHPKVALLKKTAGKDGQSIFQTFPGHQLVAHFVVVEAMVIKIRRTRTSKNLANMKEIETVPWKHTELKHRPNVFRKKKTLQRRQDTKHHKSTWPTWQLHPPRFISDILAAALETCHVQRCSESSGRFVN